MYATLPPDNSSTLRRLDSILSRFRNPCSESAELPLRLLRHSHRRCSLHEALSVCRQSHQRNCFKLSVACSSRPFTANKYFPSVILMPGNVSGAVSAGGPVLAVIDLRELISVVLDDIIRTKQARLRGRVGLARAADKHVPHLNLPQHLSAQIGKLRTAKLVHPHKAHTSQRSRQVQTVQVRIVEEVSLDAPGLAILLLPFLTQIDCGEHPPIVDRLTPAEPRVSRSSALRRA